MNNFEEINSSRYAQMQSSILNKTGGSVSSNSGSKLNLTGKFALMEEQVRVIESDAQDLTKSARVNLA